MEHTTSQCTTSRRIVAEGDVPQVQVDPHSRFIMARAVFELTMAVVAVSDMSEMIKEGEKSQIEGN
jgi:hypothetical protein